MIFDGKCVKWLEEVVGPHHWNSLFELTNLDGGTDKVLVAIDMEHRNSDSLVNQTFHNCDIKLTALKSIEGNRCSVLIEQVIAFVLNFLWSHSGSISVSLKEEVLVFVALIVELGVILL